MTTIWELRSVDGKQIVRATRPAYPDDYRFVHEYQRIIYRGNHPETLGIAPASPSPQEAR